MFLVVGMLTGSSMGGGIIPSEWAMNLTVYHVNERSAGPIPVDMDTADLQGDMYFEMHSLVLPLECNTPSSVRKPFECENAEVTSSDLVVNVLELEVDRRFGTYGACPRPQTRVFFFGSMMPFQKSYISLPRPKRGGADAIQK